MGIRERSYEVLYQWAPVWEVGAGTPDVIAGSHYPGDYAGKVIAVRPADAKPSLKDCSDKTRPVIVLPLTNDEVARLALRELKIMAGRPALATFDDRWGEVARTLRANFRDPAQAEREAAAEPETEQGRRFTELAGLAMSMLPANVAHSGTGLYCVKSGPAHNDDTQSGARSGQTITLTTGGLGTADAWKGGYVTNATEGETRAIVSHTDTTVTLEGSLTNWTDGDDLDIYDAWSTIQGAADQLWTDQGSAHFTAIQTVRVFAGTYTENVSFNLGLQSTDVCYLLFEANGSDAVTIDGTAGACVTGLSTGPARVERFTFASTGDYGVTSGAVGNKSQAREVRDCTFNTYHGVSPGYGGRGSMLVEDCVFYPDSAAGIGVYARQQDNIVRRCRIHGAHKGVYLHYMGARIESCVFDGCARAITAISDYHCGEFRYVVNCTFYGSTTADIHAPGSIVLTDLVAVNNIHVNSAYCYYIRSSAGLSHVDYNCIYNATKVARVNSTDYVTLADWQAYTDWQGNSPDANSLDSDPKLTNPGSDDFSLQSDSPCRHAGHGSGVTEDYLGTVFDAAHPDIGAASTGIAETPSRPSAEVVAIDGDTVTVSIEGDADAEHRAELVRARTGEIVDVEERQGNGDVSLTAPELPARYFVVASSGNAAGRSVPSTPAEVLIPEGEGPFEETRIGIVSRLAAHAGLAQILGTDEAGVVPVYAAGPERPRRFPCVVHELGGAPDGEFDRPGRWLMALTLEAWGGSAGVNDRVVGALDEVLHRRPFDTTSWSVKRVRRTGDETRWTDDGRAELRRTTWSLVVDRRVG